MANAESALERLYEDAAVRDSLADPEAEMLLNWAEAQIMRLAGEAADDAAFDALYDELRRLLKGVNRFVGERGQMDDAAREERLDELLVRGQALGAPPAASASALAGTFAAGDDATALQALLGLLTPATDDTVSAQAASLPETEPEDAGDMDAPEPISNPYSMPDALPFSPLEPELEDAVDMDTPEPVSSPDSTSELEPEDAGDMHAPELVNTPDSPPEPEPEESINDLWRHVSAFLKPHLYGPTTPETPLATDTTDSIGDDSADGEAQYNRFD